MILALHWHCILLSGEQAARREEEIFQETPPAMASGQSFWGQEIRGHMRVPADSGQKGGVYGSWIRISFSIITWLEFFQAVADATLEHGK